MHQYLGMFYNSESSYGHRANHALAWAGLEALGFGANLQHYNPIVDEGLAKEFNIPSDWSLKAQLVFGSIEGPPNEKTFKPVEERLKVFGAQ